jgi:hypothetical protein
VIQFARSPGTDLDRDVASFFRTYADAIARLATDDVEAKTLHEAAA